MKRWLKRLLLVPLALLLVLVGYVIYVLAAYHRIPDNQELEVLSPAEETEAGTVTTGTEYSIITYNVGFGAYAPEYSFFMDGGKYSWALSKEKAQETLDGAAALVQSYDPDFLFLQEIDLDATRSYHLDERTFFDEALPAYWRTWAVDYDSPFLFWPLTQPHGKSLAAMGTYSRYSVTSSLRRSLPIAQSLAKLVDLDRCYSITRVPTDNGKELILVCVHLSAYGTDDAVRDGQLEMLAADLQAEQEAGNYVICGGDFNHDLLAEDTGELCATWAYPLDRTFFGDNISLALDLLSDEEQDALAPSARNADMPYVEGETTVLTIDGFLLSDNVELVEYETIDTGFAYSDHNPVRMVFSLS